MYCIPLMTHRRLPNRCRAPGLSPASCTRQPGWAALTATGWGPDQAVAEQSEELADLRRAISEARVAAELNAQLTEKRALQARTQTQKPWRP